ncbi:MAG TPA: thioredoxin family protein [Verrucomicrobiota bacterium]|nr:thioredoxin family protein [Verrucomicrobiota bacterium]
MNILIIGPGCSKCKTLAQFTEQAVKELGVTAEINKVTDLKQIMALGVMMTPALAVDGKVKLAGRVPSVEEIKKLLEPEAYFSAVRVEALEELKKL